ncbi:MAG: hypothetical protein ABR576_00615 [Thermoanaerobaculia bacterium]
MVCPGENRASLPGEASEGAGRGAGVGVRVGDWAGVGVRVGDWAVVGVRVGVGVGPDCGSTRRVADHAPAVPPELIPRTRHQRRRAGSPPIEAWETVVVRLATRGAGKVLESSSWIKYEAAPLTFVQSKRIG